MYFFCYPDINSFCKLAKLFLGYQNYLQQLFPCFHVAVRPQIKHCWLNRKPISRTRLSSVAAYSELNIGGSICAKSGKPCQNIETLK